MIISTGAKRLHEDATRAIAAGRSFIIHPEYFALSDELSVGGILVGDFDGKGRLVITEVNPLPIDCELQS